MVCALGIRIGWCVCVCVFWLGLEIGCAHFRFDKCLCICVYVCMCVCVYVSLSERLTTWRNNPIFQSSKIDKTSPCVISLLLLRSSLFKSSSFILLIILFIYYHLIYLTPYLSHDPVAFVDKYNRNTPRLS